MLGLGDNFSSGFNENWVCHDAFGFEEFFEGFSVLLFWKDVLNPAFRKG